MDEDEMRLERRDTMDARDPAGVLPLLLLSLNFFSFRGDKETSKPGGGSD